MGVYSVRTWSHNILLDGFCLPLQSTAPDVAGRYVWFFQWVSWNFAFWFFCKFFREFPYLYLRRHSPWAGWAGITNCVDHVSDGGTPGSTVLCEFTRDFHPVLSLSCVAEDTRYGERFQVSLDRGCPCLQLASSSSAPRARRCGKEEVLVQFPFGTSCDMTKPAAPSLHDQCRYACKAEAATQFHGWHIFKNKVWIAAFPISQYRTSFDWLRYQFRAFLWTRDIAPVSRLIRRDFKKSIQQSASTWIFSLQIY